MQYLSSHQPGGAHGWIAVAVVLVVIASQPEGFVELVSGVQVRSPPPAHDEMLSSVLGAGTREIERAVHSVEINRLPKSLPPHTHDHHGLPCMN